MNLPYSQSNFTVNPGPTKLIKCNVFGDVLI